MANVQQSTMYNHISNIPKLLSLLLLDAQITTMCCSPGLAKPSHLSCQLSINLKQVKSPLCNFSKYTAEHPPDELLMATGYITGGLKPLD